MHQPRKFMRQLVRRGALVVLAAGLWFGAADPARAADEPEHTVTKVVVSLTDHTELKLDLTKPEDWTLLTGFLKQGKVEHFVAEKEIDLFALRWDLGLWTIVVFGL